MGDPSSLGDACAMGWPVGTVVIPKNSTELMVKERCVKEGCPHTSAPCYLWQVGKLALGVTE